MMERFTTYKDGWRVLGDGAYMDDALSVRGEAIDCLAAYEDTGLTPEEFKESADLVLELNKKLAAYKDLDAEPEEIADVLAFCTKDGICKEFYVHRLVAEAFIPNPDGLPMVNHKDEDKTNNFAENLEWCTNEYNVNYGTAKERRAKKIRGRVSPHAVIVEAFGEKRTRKEWGEMYGVDPHNIERRMSRGWDAEKAITTPLMKNQYALRRQAQRGR